MVSLKAKKSHYSSIWKYPAVHSKHPNDTILDKIVRQIAYWIQFIFDYEQRIRAASLAYFTFFGLVPFCSVFMWFTDSLKTETSVSLQLGTIFPGMKDTFDSIAEFAEANMDKLSETWAPWLALIIIVYAVFCMFDNIQKIFNEIWKSTSRTMPMRIRMSILSFVALALVIILGSYLFHRTENHLFRLVVSNVLIFCSLSGAFFFFPFDKKPAASPIFISAGLTTVLLMLWVRLIPVIDRFVAAYQSVGLLSFLLIFWIYVAWMIIVFGAKYCRNRDKSGDTYLKEEIENLSPVFRCYLSMVVTSYIFRNTVNNTSGDYALTFEQIRREMFNAPEGAHDKATGARIDNSQAFLPMPLLDQIIDDLCDRNWILLRKNTATGVVYCPNKSMAQISTFTVGDFLFDYFMAGGVLSTFKYEKLHDAFEDSLMKDFAKMFADHDRLIVDLTVEKNLEPFDFSALVQEGEEYNIKYERKQRKMYDQFVAARRQNASDPSGDNSAAPSENTSAPGRKRGLLARIFGNR